VIERAVITATAGRLNLDRAVPEATAASSDRTGEPQPERIRTAKELEEMERTNIIRALDVAKWKVSGENGAARLLGLNASTLSSRMKALKIEKTASH
jgi:transcriptional regulator with GAF, ATPase, and Fis domain